MKRILRSYRHVAQREHWCDRCCTYIKPGEMYEGTVGITGNNNLMVLKMHIYPACEYPPEPVDSQSRSRRNTKTIEKKVKTEKISQKAA